MCAVGCVSAAHPTPYALHQHTNAQTHLPHPVPCALDAVQMRPKTRAQSSNKRLKQMTTLAGGGIAAAISSVPTTPRASGGTAATSCGAMYSPVASPAARADLHRVREQLVCFPPPVHPPHPLATPGREPRRLPMLARLRARTHTHIHECIHATLNAWFKKKTHKQIRENEHNKLQARHESYMREASIKQPSSSKQPSSCKQPSVSAQEPAPDHAQAETGHSDSVVVSASAVTPSRALSTPSKRRLLGRLVCLCVVWGVWGDGALIVTVCVNVSRGV